MDKTSRNPVYTWEKVPDSKLEKFKKHMEDKYNTRFDSYWELHQWSINHYTKFWEEMWHCIGVIASKPYDEVFVKTGKGFLDNDWFRGAEFNYTENILRKRDNEVALICLDELGNEDILTFAEMFEEVKLYAAAFRKNGLKKGDTVACFMSNRKEAVIAMLATLSIGAIWGETLPYYGARAASNIVKMLDPKFLIAVDTHQDNGVLHKTIDHLPLIVNSAPTIEKVILVATQTETHEKDLSNIRNCIFLDEFLQDGRTQDGNVPDIAFEQLSFNHPIYINFTSGTTGVPKGVIHSAGTLISMLRDFLLHYDIKNGDVVCSIYPAGWTLLDYFVSSLALGAKLFLYCGSACYQFDNGMNFLDLLHKYNVKLTFLATVTADKFEKIHLVPRPDSTLDNLKIVLIGGSPVKKENIEYFRNKVKKEAFICDYYGSAEAYGSFSGLDFNMPVHAGEVQVPSLGMDIQCFDEQGRSVIGQRGELVICTPAPNFPIGLWKDKNFELITETYFSKYPGVWAQHDKCWINPETKGIIVVGRSDDTLNQNTERLGSSDIYFAIHSLEELQDYICVNQQKTDGDCRTLLLVKMQNGCKLTPDIRAKIEKAIEDELFEDCVPEIILDVPDIPYNLNNKRMESVVRKIVNDNKIPEVMNIKNPESLKHFLNIQERIFAANYL